MSSRSVALAAGGSRRVTCSGATTTMVWRLAGPPAGPGRWGALHALAGHGRARLAAGRVGGCPREGCPGPGAWRRGRDGAGRPGACRAQAGRRCRGRHRSIAEAAADGKERCHREQGRREMPMEPHCGHGVRRAGHRAPAQVGLAGRRRLVEAPNRRVVRRRAQQLRVAGGPPLRRRGAPRRRHRGLERLRLRRLDEQALLDDQREVDRRRMEAVVDEALGDVERAHAGLVPDGRAVATNSCLQGRGVGQLVGVADAACAGSWPPARRHR